jgi:hypothetical protein
MAATILGTQPLASTGKRVRLENVQLLRLVVPTMLAGALGACLLVSSRPRVPTYNADIRPILSENCFFCHGPDANQRKGDLRLDLRADALEAEAWIPGDRSRSLAWERIQSVQAREQMPPPDSHRTLSETQKELIGRWIDAGAVYEEHWAFQAPIAADVAGGPQLIDTLVDRKLRERGWKRSTEAQRATLLRRVTLDLTGLPPTPEAIESFCSDARPDAYERVVMRLLDSPHYGERMALPWLDAARYADSNGFQQDGDTFQWLWRDWLVRQLNADKPFDQLTKELLAGDLLPDASDETRLGTAFLRNHLLNGEGGAIPEENRFVALFDRVDATATTWMGLTMSCAQCHDHKYDPITQRDYYALLDAFQRVPESGVVDGSPSRIRVAPPVVEPASTAQRERRAELERARDAAAEGDARNAAQGQLDQFLRDEWPRVMVMSDAQPRTTHILQRGDYQSPADAVVFATPGFLPPMEPEWPRNRLGLAQWLLDEKHPLTARVAVNQAWQLFFGRGLVATPEDFGTQSAVPLQQELLDTLAVRWRESGWRLKELHRWIVLSKTYRQSSVADQSQVDADPLNEYLSRAPRHRLPAPLLRDLALASSGLLVTEIGGPPVYPYQPDRVWESLAITRERDFTYPASKGSDLYRRSLYSFWRRTIAPLNMFDSSQRQSCKVRPVQTNLPLHALTMLNDPTWVEAGRVLAQRTCSECSGDAARLQRMFLRVVSRMPDEESLRALETLLDKQRKAFSADPAAARAYLAIGERTPDTQLDPVELAAWSRVGLGIYNLHEAMCRE